MRSFHARRDFSVNSPRPWWRLAPLLLALLAQPGLGWATPADGAPPLALAQVYQDGLDLGRYWVSEKLDGVRAYWDGEKLVSRQGKPIRAPAWFVAGFPRQPLDGELWLGRGQFERLVGTVRRQDALDAEWQQVRYMVYDLPQADGNFNQRLARLQDLVRQAASPWLVALEQFRVADKSDLLRRRDQVLAAGGEGLMLHRDDRAFVSGRSDALQKLKPYQDGEARVVGHLPGKGKYAGQVGALALESADGRRFAVGSGLPDSLRQAPPAIGSQITYRYSGLTAHGQPRFPRFHRIYDPI